MRQLRYITQTRFVRRAANCVNGFMFEQQQFIIRGTVDAFSGGDVFLQSKRLIERHAAEPARFKRCVHICAPPGTPNRAASWERKCVMPMANASASSAPGVSVKPSDARTMNAT